MKILADIGHQKNAHIMGQLARVLRARGHTLHFIYRDRERLGELCNALGLQGESRGKGGKGWLGKLAYLLRADLCLLQLSGRLQPDLLLSFASPYLAHVARMRGIPMVVFDDTEDNRLVQRIYLKSASRIVVPACFAKEIGEKQIRFRGYFELAYLHPNRFSPDYTIRNELGCPESEKYILLRTVAWKAVHDLGHRGLGQAGLRRLVNELSKMARVFISAEGALPPDLEAFRLQLPPQRIHHVLAAASLVFSEGATMAAEGAVLGVPTVHCSDLKPGYITDLENRHGLIQSFCRDAFPRAVDSAKDMARAGKELLLELGRRRERMLAESADVVQVMMHEIEGCVSSDAHEQPRAGQ